MAPSQDALRLGFASCGWNIMPGPIDQRPCAIVRVFPNKRHPSWGRPWLASKWLPEWLRKGELLTPADSMAAEKVRC